MRRNNNKYFIVFCLVLISCVSIGYSLINKTLNISGNSEIKKNSWKIAFEYKKISNGSVNNYLDNVKITDDNLVEFNCNLKLPGDFFEFYLYIENSGTIDAMIESFEKTLDLTEEQKKYVNYIIEYENGEQIKTKQMLPKKSFVKLRVKVEYRTDITEFDLPTVEQSINLSFAINYIQSDGTGEYVTDYGVLDLGTFYYDGRPYIYEKGMTWNAFTDHDVLNKVGFTFTLSSELTPAANSNSCIELDGNVVKLSDFIVESGQYYVGSCGKGSNEPE